MIETSELKSNIMKDKPASTKMLLKSHSFGVTFLSFLIMYSTPSRLKSKNIAETKMLNGLMCASDKDTHFMMIRIL